MHIFDSRLAVCFDRPAGMFVSLLHPQPHHHPPTNPQLIITAWQVLDEIAQSFSFLAFVALFANLCFCVLCLLRKKKREKGNFVANII